MTKLYSLQDGSKGHLVAAVDLYEDEEPELLLCYNSRHILSLSFIFTRKIIYVLNLSFFNTLKARMINDRIKLILKMLTWALSFLRVL